jgi:8-oxo-dGTP pyrophosphatase MutT (NUDIX family)
MLKHKNNRQGLAAGKGDDYQVGVFAFTDNEEVVLVTGRKSEEWILPKGNTAKCRSDREQAREEAYEEAGLEGTMQWKYFEFDVHGKVNKLRVYPMKVTKICKDFPEKKQRKRILTSFDEAERISKGNYSEIIRELRKQIG